MVEKNETKIKDKKKDIEIRDIVLAFIRGMKQTIAILEALISG